VALVWWSAWTRGSRPRAGAGQAIAGWAEGEGDGLGRLVASESSQPCLEAQGHRRVLAASRPRREIHIQLEPHKANTYALERAVLSENEQVRDMIQEYSRLYSSARNRKEAPLRVVVRSMRAQFSRGDVIQG